MNGGDRHLEDCYYYLNSSCRRGHDCTFRHSPDARASTKICPEWERTRRCTVDCPLRHITHQVQRRKADEYCYFEDKEPGCTKPFCEFKHKNPDKDAWKLSELQNGPNESTVAMQEGNAGHGWMHDSRFLGGNLSGVQDLRYDNTQQSETTARHPDESAACQEYDLVDGSLASNSASVSILASEADSREHPDSGSRYWARKGSITSSPHHVATRGLSEYSSGDMTIRGKPFRAQSPLNIRNNPNATPGTVHSDGPRSEEKNHVKPSGNDDYKKSKPNAFDAEDRRANDGRREEQYASRASEQRDRPGNRRAGRDGAEFHSSDKGYFKKIRMENRILVNEIEDVEREIDEIERRISQENRSSQH